MGDAFIVACARGAAEEVQQFLTDGVDPDTVHSTVGASALIAAVDRGRATCVELLLGAGAKVDQAPNDGATPLFIAALQGQEKCVELLLGAGAKVDQAENNGDTPLSNALQKGHKKCAALLRAAGAKDVR